MRLIRLCASGLSRVGPTAPSACGRSWMTPSSCFGPAIPHRASTAFPWCDAATLGVPGFQGCCCTCWHAGLIIGCCAALAQVDEKHFVTGSQGGELALWFVGRKKPMVTVSEAHGSAGACLAGVCRCVLGWRVSWRGGAWPAH